MSEWEKISLEEYLVDVALNVMLLVFWLNLCVGSGLENVHSIVWNTIIHHPTLGRRHGGRAQVERGGVLQLLWIALQRSWTLTCEVFSTTN